MREFPLCYSRHPGLRRVFSGVGVTGPATDPVDPLKLFRAVSRGDGANLESRRATVTQFRALEVATLRLFGRFISGRATVTQFRALEVATLAPFARSNSWCAPRFVPGSKEAARGRRTHHCLYTQTPDRPPQRLLLVGG